MLGRIWPGLSWVGLGFSINLCSPIDGIFFVRPRHPKENAGTAMRGTLVFGIAKNETNIFFCPAHAPREHVGKAMECLLVCGIIIDLQY